MVHSLRQAKSESYLNRLLEGKDADFQRRILAVTVEHGLSTSDPLFLIMLATGQLQVLLEDKPAELDLLFKRWAEGIYDHLEKAKRTAIAEKLYISIGTVKSDVRSILFKLNADDRTQAAICALRRGLVQ
jgi:Bacterial regulatory proteins, luxR family